MFVRLVYVLHVTWFVNSATHIWGYRNYETTRRQPQPVVGRPAGLRRRLAQQPPRLPAHGQAGHKWWEIDVTYWAILASGKGRPGLERRQGSAQEHEAGVSRWSARPRRVNAGSADWVSGVTAALCRGGLKRAVRGLSSS